MFLKRSIFEYFTICLEWNLNNLKGKIAEGQETITKINDKQGTLTLKRKKLEHKLKDLDKKYENICLLLQ